MEKSGLNHENTSEEILAWVREPWCFVAVFWGMLFLTMLSGVQYVTRAARMLSGVNP